MSHSVPVFEGYCLPHAVQRFTLAGIDVTLHLKKVEGPGMRRIFRMRFAEFHYNVHLPSSLKSYFLQYFIVPIQMNMKLLPFPYIYISDHYQHKSLCVLDV